MATSLEESEKLDWVKKNLRKFLPFGEKILKIGLVDTEIALLRVIKINKEEETRNCMAKPSA